MNRVSHLRRTICPEEHRTKYPCADRTNRPRPIQQWINFGPCVQAKAAPKGGLVYLLTLGWLVAHNITNGILHVASNLRLGGALSSLAKPRADRGRREKLRKMPVRGGIVATLGV